MTDEQIIELKSKEIIRLHKVCKDLQNQLDKLSLSNFTIDDLIGELSCRNREDRVVSELPSIDTLIGIVRLFLRSLDDVFKFEHFLKVMDKYSPQDIENKLS